MKNPFKKADSAKLPAQGKERTEIDYAHRTIIHHMLYAYPDAFSGCASYPDYDDPEMFAQMMAQAEDAVKKLDLDEHTPVSTSWSALRRSSSPSAVWSRPAISTTRPP